MSGLLIKQAANGYILKYYDDENECNLTEVIEESEVDELKAGETLLWWLMDHYGFGGSKHDAERIRIVRVKRDAPEEP
jgi:hypothetical protein